jgi:hypothetical protein
LDLKARLKKFNENHCSTIAQIAKPDDSPHPEHSTSQVRRLDIEKISMGYFKYCGERFPAMEKLSLTHYDWVHSKDTYKLLWDFSRIRTLSLGLGSKLCKFLRSVPSSDLPELQCLEIYGDEDTAATVTLLQKRLSSFLSGLGNLKKFKIETKFFEKFLDLESLAVTASNTLENFRFRDTDWDWESGIPNHTLSIRNLSVLQSSFPQLKYLSFDLVMQSQEASHCYSACSTKC